MTNLSNYIMIMLKIISEAMHKTKQGRGLKINS